MNIRKILFLLVITIFLFNSCTPILKYFYGEKIYNAYYLTRPPEEFIETELQYEIIDNRIIFPVIVDNKKYNFIFDTGSPITLISNKIYLKNKVTGVVLTNSDANNSKFKNELINYNISLGNLNVNNFPISIANLDFLNNESCIEIDGIIGSNILNQGVFMFDHLNRKLKISNSKIKKEINEVEFNVKMGSLIIPIQNKNYQIDTGYGGFILTTLNSRIINKNVETKSFESSLDGLTSSKIIEAVSTVQDIKIGNGQYTGIVDLINTKTKYALIGVDLFKKNDITIDYLNKKIYISNENRFTQKDNLNIVNISFKIINETIIVKSIVKNSAFDKIGIKLGDVIQSVNDKKGRTFKNSCELKEFLSYHHENNMNLTIEILNKKNELITKTFTTNDIYEYPKRIK